MEQQAKPARETLVLMPTKSVGVSLILTFLFGSLGMFYSTIAGAIIMIIAELIIGFFTLGIGLLITHPICMIWGAIAAHRYNQKLLRGES